MLGCCQVFYVIIGVGLYLVFQDDTQSDVLLNFSVDSLGPLVGDGVAEAITYIVWLGYVPPFGGMEHVESSRALSCRGCLHT